MSHGEAERLRNQLASQQFELKQQLAELQAALGMKTDGVVVCCDWLAGMFLSSGKRGDNPGKTSWQFLSSLESSGVPAAVADLARSITQDVSDTRLQASVVLSNGILGDYTNVPWSNMLFLTAPASRSPPRLTSRCAVRTPCMPAIDLILHHPFFV